MSLEKQCQPDKSSGKHHLAWTASCLGAWENHSWLMLISWLAVNRPCSEKVNGAVILFWSGLSQLVTAISLLGICWPRRLEGGLTSLSKRKLQEEHRHMMSLRALLWLVYKVSSTNMCQYPTMGNLTAVGNGTDVLLCLCLQETASLPFESMLNRRVSKTWTNCTASDIFNPWQMPQHFSLGQSASILDTC